MKTPNPEESKYLKMFWDKWLPKKHPYDEVKGYVEPSDKKGIAERQIS